MGVGQQHDFYGGPEDTSLDDAITRGESKLASIIQRLNSGDADNLVVNDVATLFGAIAVRTKAMRQAVTDLVPMVVDVAATHYGDVGVLRAALRDHSNDQQWIDGIIAAELKKLPPMSRENKARFRALALQRIRQDLASPSSTGLAFAQEAMRSLLENLRTGAAAMAQRAYCDAIKCDPFMPKWAAWLKNLTFTFVETGQQSPFVLGDCGVVAICEDGSARLAIGRDEERGAAEIFVLPISPVRCVIGRRSTATEIPNVLSINAVSASMSCEFFISHSPVVDDLERLKTLINTAIPIESEAAIRDYISR